MCHDLISGMYSRENDWKVDQRLISNKINYTIKHILIGCYKTKTKTKFVMRNSVLVTLGIKGLYKSITQADGEKLKLWSWKSYLRYDTKFSGLLNKQKLMYVDLQI